MKWFKSEHQSFNPPALDKLDLEGLSPQERQKIIKILRTATATQITAIREALAQRAADKKAAELAKYQALIRKRGSHFISSNEVDLKKLTDRKYRK